MVYPSNPMDPDSLDLALQGLRDTVARERGSIASDIGPLRIADRRRRWRRLRPFGIVSALLRLRHSDVARMTMLPLQKPYICGRYVDASSRATFETINPAITNSPASAARAVSSPSNITPSSRA